MEFLRSSLCSPTKLHLLSAFPFSRNTHSKDNPLPPPEKLSINGEKPKLSPLSQRVSDIKFKSWNFFLSGSLALALSLSGLETADAKSGVNKPELLPSEFTTIIDVAGFLSDGQEKRLAEEISSIEKETGFKLRVLAQNYPNTPGLAIKDFWQVDDKTVVFVADPTFGNIIHFNVGAEVDIGVPRNFWSRVAGKYGNIFYWKEKGEDASIEAAVVAVSNCLRDPEGPNSCASSLED